MRRTPLVIDYLLARSSDSFGQEYSCFRSRQGQDRLILRARIDLGDGRDIVADGTASPDNGEVAALVGKKSHGLVAAVASVCADEDDFLVRDGIGRITDCGLDVFTNERG